MASPRPLPLTIKIILALTSLQVLYLLIDLLQGLLAAHQLGQASVIASFYLILALALGAGAAGLYQGKGYGRALVLVWELFAVIIGVQLALAGATFWGLVSLGVAATIILLLFSSSSLAYLFPERKS